MFIFKYFGLYILLNLVCFKTVSTVSYDLDTVLSIQSYFNIIIA